MKIGIVGFGREGKMALKYWGKNATFISVYDKNTSIALPKEVTPRLGDLYKQHLIQDAPHLDLIVRSPGIPLWDIADQIKTPITTITREFFDRCPCPIIGVTGTKGKGTTATLIQKILTHAGKDVHLVGNIGTPALAVLPQLTPDSIVVYELSSFQLFDLHKSPHIAVCLLVTEDHLDWHRDLAHYQQSKGNIFAHQQKPDYAIWYADNAMSVSLATQSPSINPIAYGSKSVVRVLDGYFMYGDTKICTVADALLTGIHNQQNICAAIAAVYHLVPLESIIHTIKTFSGLPYHIEDKGIVHGIQFFNDSFSVNPTATSVAIACMSKPTTLLIGGVDRGLHLEPFVEAIQQNNRIENTICYGEEGMRIAQILENASIPHTHILDSFETVFKQALACSKEGDAILFSPGAPSFDMFTDYIARGEAFNALLEKYRQNLL